MSGVTFGEMRIEFVAHEPGSVTVYVRAAVASEPDLDKLIAALNASRQLLAPPNEPANDGKRKGGLARAASMTPERRSEIARNAAAKRWGASDSDRNRNGGDRETGLRAKHESAARRDRPQ